LYKQFYTKYFKIKIIFKKELIIIFFKSINNYTIKDKIEKKKYILDIIFLFKIVFFL